MVEQIALYPGAITAGGNLTLPAWAKPIRTLLDFVVKRKNSITWSGLGATGATIATDDVSASGSGSDTLAEAVRKSIVTTTPSAGEVQLIDERTIAVGDAIADGDVVIITYIAKGEYEGA